MGNHSVNESFTYQVSQYMNYEVKIIVKIDSGQTK